jgi:hypothetical protein
MENKKNILLSIHNIDSVAYKFNNKFKFMNLQHLVQIIDSMSEEQLENCANAISKVESVVNEFVVVLDSLESVTIDLISSYDRTNYSQRFEQND